MLPVGRTQLHFELQGDAGLSGPWHDIRNGNRRAFCEAWIAECKRESNRALAWSEYTPGLETKDGPRMINFMFSDDILLRVRAGAWTFAELEDLGHAFQATYARLTGMDRYNARVQELTDVYIAAKAEHAPGDEFYGSPCDKALFALKTYRHDEYPRPGGHVFWRIEIEGD